jgi:hypothetical protein
MSDITIENRVGRWGETVGRIVHIVLPVGDAGTPVVFPGIVTSPSSPPSASYPRGLLTLIEVFGFQLKRPESAPYSETYKLNHWTWPPKQEQPK